MGEWRLGREKSGCAFIGIAAVLEEAHLCVCVGGGGLPDGPTTDPPYALRFRMRLCSHCAFACASAPYTGSPVPYTSRSCTPARTASSRLSAAFCRSTPDGCRLMM